MKHAFYLIPLFAAAPLAAQPVLDAPQAIGPVKVQLDAMPLGALVTVLMRDVMRVPYVIAPDVIADNRPVSVNLAIPRGDLPVRVVQFLRSLGLAVELRGGTVYVSKQPLGAEVQGGQAMVPSGSPLTAPSSMPGQVASAPAIDAAPQEVAIVTPAHRSVLELAEMVESVLPSVSIAARRDSAPDGGQIVDHFEPDRLVIAGSKADLARAVAIVRAVDRPRPVVDIKAVVFEVRTTQANRSALSLLASIGGFSVASFPGQAPGDQYVRIATGGIQAALSATSGDGRFKVVSQPSLSAVSGSAARINSGSQVPTVGAVSFSENGTPVKSVVYRDSGVSLTVRPVVRPGGIELKIEQERSSFVRTNTGVDETPTLNRSQASTQVIIAPGETIAFAGLDETSEGSSKSGFLGGIFSAKQRDKSSAQLVVMVQADLLPVDSDKEAAVMFITDEKPKRKGASDAVKRDNG